jgi:hypothetical protein
MILGGSGFADLETGDGLVVVRATSTAKAVTS